MTARKLVGKLRLPDLQQSFRMIDVGGKLPTRRTAIATGSIHVGPTVFQLIQDKALPKGDALSLAEVAGVLAAKKTPEIIPLCHPLPLDAVHIAWDLDPSTATITAYCLATCVAKTGVEMEALAGATGALMTVYDLSKGTEPDLRMGEIKLLLKAGGKSGVWLAPSGVPDWVQAMTAEFVPLGGVTAAILVLSDRASRGEYEDRSGPALRRVLEAAGAEVVDQTVIPDDRASIEAHLKQIKAQHDPRLILTSGGTGFSPRDVTPEAVMAVCDRMLPGIGEMLRDHGEHFINLSWCSRSVAGLMGDTLVITMPGNPKAVEEGWESLLPILPHSLNIASGDRRQGV